MNKTLNYKGLEYEIIEIERVYLYEEQLDKYVNKLLKSYMIQFKYERLNMCMFKRTYRNCTKKQIDYLVSIIDYTFDYELSDKQIKFLSKCSISEISTLLNRFKNMEVVTLSEHDFKRDSLGNIIY